MKMSIGMLEVKGKERAIPQYLYWVGPSSIYFFHFPYATFYDSFLLKNFFSREKFLFFSHTPFFVFQCLYCVNNIPFSRTSPTWFAFANSLPWVE